MGDDKPFVCLAPGCGQRFTNEDHLAVHKHKHEMTLKLGPMRSDSVIVADQTPTPTRFLKNCEEVGLFHELSGSFDSELKRPSEESSEDAAGKREETTGGKKPPRQPEGSESESVRVKEPVTTESYSPQSAEPRPDTPVTQTSNGKDLTTTSRKPAPSLPRPSSLHLLSRGDGTGVIPQTLDSPTAVSVITQAPPANRQIPPLPGPQPIYIPLHNGQSLPLGFPGPPPSSLPMSPSLASSGVAGGRVIGVVPNIPGIPGPPLNHTGPPPPQPHSEAKMHSPIYMGQISPGHLSPQAIGIRTCGGRRRRMSEDDPDERRRKFLERNRAAATRCRLKRKAWVLNLEQKAEELVQTNLQLQNEVTMLRNEVSQLKQLLLAHKDCPVTTLQRSGQGYLSDEDSSASSPTSACRLASGPSNGIADARTGTGRGAAMSPAASRSLPLAVQVRSQSANS
uniref:Cyclic AMP-dependent transcription factor ATF-2 n=1 Tax=Eptatretus burgeri TaxID=7764 RepID=A0A8C4MZG5_EPTBU